MVDISASIHRNVPDLHERKAELNFDFVSLEEVKDDVKTEEKATNESEEEAMGREQDQQPPPQDEDDLLEPESGNYTNNTRKHGNSDRRNPSKSHKCEHCDYSAQYKSHLDMHLLKHTGEKPHGCNSCPKRFTSKRNLNAHTKVHVEEFLFHCSSCLQGFDVQNKKVAHEVNCKALRYECYLCKESFGTHKKNMIHHMQVHRGNRAFECEECFKQFTFKSSLNTHMKLHDGPRLFRCSKCHQRFSQQDERNVHELKCNRSVYECDICGKSFGLNKSNVINHMRTHSGEKPFECQRCSKKFTRKPNLNRHMLLHTKEDPFECLVCRRGFSKDNNRKAHQRNCNSRYYECYLCQKFFHTSPDKLKGHMHIHSGEKPFQCKVCRNTFTQKSSLKTHMKNIHNKKY